MYHKNGTRFHNTPYCSGYDTTLWVIAMLLGNRMNFCGTSILVTAYFKGEYKLQKFIHGYWAKAATWPMFVPRHRFEEIATTKQRS